MGKKLVVEEKEKQDVVENVKHRKGKNKICVIYIMIALKKKKKKKKMRNQGETKETKAAVAGPPRGPFTRERMEENIRSDLERIDRDLIARPQITDHGHPFYQRQLRLKRAEAFGSAMTVRDHHRPIGHKLGDDATNKVLEFAGLNGGRKRKSRKNKGRGGPKKRKTRKKTRRRRKRKRSRRPKKRSKKKKTRRKK